MLKGVFLTAFSTPLYRCKKFIPLVFYFVKLLAKIYIIFCNFWNQKEINLSSYWWKFLQRYIFSTHYVEVIDTNTDEKWMNNLRRDRSPLLRLTQPDGPLKCTNQKWSFWIFIYYGLGWLLPFFSNNQTSNGIEHRIKLDIHQDG